MGATEPLEALLETLTAVPVKPTSFWPLIALMISTYPCLLILMNTVYRWWQPSVISDGMRPGVPSHLLPTVSGGWGF